MERGAGGQLSLLRCEKSFPVSLASYFFMFCFLYNDVEALLFATKHESGIVEIFRKFRLSFRFKVLSEGCRHLVATSIRQNETTSGHRVLKPPLTYDCAHTAPFPNAHHSVPNHQPGHRRKPILRKCYAVERRPIYFSCMTRLPRGPS